MRTSCALATALQKLSELLIENGVAEVIHMGTFNCRTISGSERLSQHAFGAAIDIWGFVDKDGHEIIVEQHWEAETPITSEGKLLKSIADSLYDAQTFNIVLTPNYNDAHKNHLHLDLTPGAHFIGSIQNNPTLSSDRCH